MIAWTKISSLIMFIGVAAGAFGAHALKEKLSAYSLDIWHTATLYLFVHGLAVLVLALASRDNAPLLQLVQPTLWCFTAGIIIFSGSLYALALSDLRILGAITPIGGALFLIGWLLLFIKVN